MSKRKEGQVSQPQMLKQPKRLQKQQEPQQSTSDTADLEKMPGHHYVDLEKMPGHHYVVWNNKGGTGKTTLTFHLSTQYAIDNKNKKVLVIDMCPQANISSALLVRMDARHGGTPGDEVLDEIISGPKIKEKYDKSVCGYLMSQIVKEDVDPKEFLIQPSEYNKYITNNVYLLCGYPYLEVLAKRLEQERRLDDMGSDKPWLRVTLFIKNFIQKLGEDYTVFIDTNPAFTVYTELAISAATRIIVPVNADDFSRSALHSLLWLLYGIPLRETEDDLYHTLQADKFSSKADTYKLEVPKIYLVISNRITNYRTRASMAFGAKANDIWDILRAVGDRVDGNKILVNVEEKEYEMEMIDLHKNAVLCLHLGCPVSSLPSQVSMRGDGEKVKISLDDKERYLKYLRKIVERL